MTSGLVFSYRAQFLNGVSGLHPLLRRAGSEVTGILHAASPSRVSHRQIRWLEYGRSGGQLEQLANPLRGMGLPSRPRLDCAVLSTAFRVACTERRSGELQVAILPAYLKSLFGDRRKVLQGRRGSRGWSEPAAT